MMLMLKKTMNAAVKEALNNR